MTVTIDVLASGSGANCYLLREDDQSLMLECGLHEALTLNKLGYKLPDALLVTHCHSDHSWAAHKFLKRGVPTYMTQGTADTLNLHRHNLHIIKAGDEFQIGAFRVKAFAVKHDAPEPVNFQVNGLIFLTDLGEVPADLEKNFPYVLIEANHSELGLASADIDSAQKQRITENHLSVEQAIDFLKTLNEPKEIHLIHISKRHGDKKQFVGRVKSATGFDNVKGW